MRGSSRSGAKTGFRRLAARSFLAWFRAARARKEEQEKVLKVESKLGTVGTLRDRLRMRRRRKILPPRLLEANQDCHRFRVALAHPPFYFLL